jgi:hypothetical protein
MRLYPEDALETLRARKLLAEAKAEGLLTEAQYGQLARETVPSLRSTNLFLRIVLFFFTILCVAAATALFFVLFQPPHQATGILWFLFAGLCYGGSEFTVREFRFYRHGIEEALAVGSIGYLCAGLEWVFGPLAGHPRSPVSLIAAAGALFSLWIWHRFGLWYSFLLAMICVLYVPSDWISSSSAYHAIVGAFYAVGLLGLAQVRTRHRFEAVDRSYSLAEALLWLGIYLTLNLKILAMGTPVQWFSAETQAASPFGRTFYWTTWMLIWCLPPVILARGVRLKDRFVLAAGTVAALSTLAANKPYLGWSRHTWDPMLLGIFVIGTALYLRRWLRQGPGGVRHGFTAARLSRGDSDLMKAGSSALGFFSPRSLVPGPQPGNPDLGLDGGASGGGGATRDF